MESLPKKMYSDILSNWLIKILNQYCLTEEASYLFVHLFLLIMNYCRLWTWHMCILYELSRILESIQWTMGYLHFENLNCLEEIWLQQPILNYLYWKTKENKLSCFYHCLVIWLILNQKVLIMSDLKLCSCLVLKWNMNFIFINI